jgi:DNA-binding protein
MSAPNNERPQLGRRIPRAKDSSSPSDGTIRIAADGYVQSYINYATKLVNEEGKKKIVVAGTGTALENAVRVAEILKRSFPNVHQQTSIGVREFNEQYEAKDNQKEVVEVKRTVPYIEVTFSLQDDLDKKHPGYQAPIDQSLVKKNLNELMGHSRSRHRDTRRAGPRRNKSRDAPVVA